MAIEEDDYSGTSLVWKKAIDSLSKEYPACKVSLFSPLTLLREQREGKNENSEPEESPRCLLTILRCISCLPSVVLIAQNPISKSTLWRRDYSPLKVQVVVPFTVLMNCTVIFYQHNYHCFVLFLNRAVLPCEIRIFQEEICIPYCCHSFLLLSALNPLHLQDLISCLENSKLFWVLSDKMAEENVKNVKVKGKKKAKFRVKLKVK